MCKAKTYNFNGTRKTVRQLAHESGLSAQLIRYRLESGWPIERVLADATANLGRPSADNADQARNMRLLHQIVKLSQDTAKLQAKLDRLHREYLKGMT